MNNKRNKLLVIILIVLIVFGILGFSLYLKNKNNDYIPNDYIAVFHGGVGEVTYSTYIYKIDNGHANYEFEYINTTNTTLFWGSPQWKQKITDKGKVTWTDEVFNVAKENNAYSYITLPNDNKIYSIEEFMSMFLLN